MLPRKKPALWDSLFIVELHLKAIKQFNHKTMDNKKTFLKMFLVLQALSGKPNESINLPVVLVMKNNGQRWAVHSTQAQIQPERSMTFTQHTSQ